MEVDDPEHCQVPLPVVKHELVLSAKRSPIMIFRGGLLGTAVSSPELRCKAVLVVILRWPNNRRWICCRYSDWKYLSLGDKLGKVVVFLAELSLKSYLLVKITIYPSLVMRYLFLLGSLLGLGIFLHLLNLDFGRRPTLRALA